MATADLGFGPRYLDDLELLREAHRQIGSRIPPEHIPSLAGLPEQWRVTPTGKDGSSKRPFLPGWNEDQKHFFVPLQLLSTNGVVLETCIGVGVLTGPASGGLLVLDFDSKTGDPEGAERKFQELFGRPSSDLPCTAVNVSGKPGRKKVYLQVPPYWWPLIGATSLKTDELDVMWLNATGHPRQAVIAGDHPEGTAEQPLTYRWLPDRHPALVGVEVAPLWLLVQLIHLLRVRDEGLQQPGAEGVSSAHTPGGEEGPRPMDLLSPGKQLALLRSMAKHWPYRGGTDCADSLGRKGHWPVMCRLVLSIWRGIDSEVVFCAWMVGSAWDKRNDWSGRTKGTSAVNGNALLPFVKSLVRSKSTEHQQVEPWAAAWAIAVENGWKPPEWALPPRELNSHELTITTVKLAKEFRKGMEVVAEMETAIDRRIARLQIREALKLQPRDYEGLLQLHQGEGRIDPLPNSVAELMALDTKKGEQIVEGLVALGQCYLFCAEGGVGKSSFIYGLAEGVTTGGTFADAFPCKQAVVLLVQVDENKLQATTKWNKMQFRPDHDRLPTPMWAFNSEMLVELEQEIVRTGAKLVLMDSFFKLFCDAGYSLNDSGIAQYLYELNDMAARHGCAIVVTAHTNKPQTRGNRIRPLTKHDVFGNAFIFNGVGGCWLLWRTQQTPQSGEVPCTLLVEKERLGAAEEGTVFEFIGNKEDYRWYCTTRNGEEMDTSRLGKIRDKVLALLRTRSKSEALGLDELQGLLGNYNRDGLRQTVTELYSERCGVDRVKIPRTGPGRPSYAYFGRSED